MENEGKTPAKETVFVSVAINFYFPRLNNATHLIAVANDC